MLNIIMSIIMAATTANQESDVQVWSVEYDGQIYTYEATTQDAEGAYIITLDGRTLYINELTANQEVSE